MKNFNKNLAALVLFTMLIAAGCEDSNNLDTEPVDSGTADFSTYVSVGNSITAGIQNAALYESAQKFSYPRLLARQFQKLDEFTQALISDPGIGHRIEIISMDPLEFRRNPNEGQPINQNEKPYSNVGISGAILVDYLNPGNSGHLKERATNPNHPAYNEFYSIVLSESNLAQPAPSIHYAVGRQNPTFVTFWLGDNDALGFVLSGGEGRPVTPPDTFAELYQSSAQALASTGADVVVYTIPDLTSIPFVFLARDLLEQKGLIVFNTTEKRYELVTPFGNLPVYIEVDGNAQYARKDDFIILRAKGQGYFTQVAAGQLPPPVTPETAIPDRLVLDGNLATSAVDSELEQVASAVVQYNIAIHETAAEFGFALVDINAIYNTIFNNFQTSGGGYDAGSLVLQPLLGSIFSFDGVHPSNRGHAVIANETIKIINNFYGASVPLINISDIPPGIPMVQN